jgi:hypothetical protein
VPSKRRLLELVLEAYREGDLSECIRLVRTLVDAAPQATAPRQLLAALFAMTGNSRQAYTHYRRLLPQAVARGDVMRAIGFQKQIDVYGPHQDLAPGRWLELQKQLRERGLPFVAEAPGSLERPWNEAQVLALPRAWFERIAAETSFEILGLDPCSLDVEAGTTWEVLAGRVRWSFALPDGRASVEALAADGDVIRIDPGLAPRARLTLIPELPLEALRFDAKLARDLSLELAAGLHAAAPSVTGLTQETRALLATRPMRREDLDEPIQVPAPSVEPPRLPSAIDGDVPPAATGDAGEGIEFGVVPLGDPPPQEGATAAGPHEPIEASPEASAPDAEQAEEPMPPDMAEGLIGTPLDLTAVSAGDGDVSVERRRHPRVTVSLESRMAVLRLSGALIKPVHGQLADMSTSGFSIRFPNDVMGPTHAALADAVVALDLDLPGPNGALRLAAQVRWLEVDESRDETRLGIEFVLLTEPDRRRIAGTLAKAALAAHAAGRKAA